MFVRFRVIVVVIFFLVLNMLSFFRLCYGFFVVLRVVWNVFGIGWDEFEKKFLRLLI